MSNARKFSIGVVGGTVSAWVIIADLSLLNVIVPALGFGLLIGFAAVGAFGK